MRLQEMREAGLHTLSLSVDAFHQAHAPIRRVATAIHAAKQVGIPHVTIESCALSPDQPGNFFDEAHRAAPGRAGGYRRGAGKDTEADRVDSPDRRRRTQRQRSAAEGMDADTRRHQARTGADLHHALARARGRHRACGDGDTGADHPGNDWPALMLTVQPFSAPVTPTTNLNRSQDPALSVNVHRCFYINVQSTDRTWNVSALGHIDRTRTCFSANIYPRSSASDALTS